MAIVALRLRWHSPVGSGFHVRCVRDKAECSHRKYTPSAEHRVWHGCQGVPPGINHIVAGQPANDRRD